LAAGTLAASTLPSWQGAHRAASMTDGPRKRTPTRARWPDHAPAATSDGVRARACTWWPVSCRQVHTLAEKLGEYACYVHVNATCRSCSPPVSPGCINASTPTQNAATTSRRADPGRMSWKGFSTCKIFPSPLEVPHHGPVSDWTVMSRILLFGWARVCRHEKPHA